MPSQDVSNIIDEIANNMLEVRAGEEIDPSYFLNDFEMNFFEEVSEYFDQYEEELFSYVVGQVGQKIKQILTAGQASPQGPTAKKETEVSKYYKQVVKKTS